MQRDGLAYRQLSSVYVGGDRPRQALTGGIKAGRVGKPHASPDPSRSQPGTLISRPQPPQPSFRWPGEFEGAFECCGRTSDAVVTPAGGVAGRSEERRVGKEGGGGGAG